MPARRELHTGRYNFLHCGWGPLEPYDDSMPVILKENNIYSHLASDHYHYWEDGGSTYHCRYNTWENFRGQDGDAWKGIIGGVEDTNPNLIKHQGWRGHLYQQDLVNRYFMQNEEDHPQCLTMKAGMEFISINAAKDNWFLQIETFDPHEPFFTYKKYKNLYPSNYSGPRFDWPDYAAVKESPEEVAEARRSYFALLSMCDHYLGKVLDLFDKFNMWKDTMLIVNTDHGYMLGEHGFWAKNHMLPYDEIVRIPLFIWDPRYGKMNETRSGLIQTIDIPATILDFFNIPLPNDFQGKPASPMINVNQPIRDAGLFGLFGRHVCCTDGKHVLMKGSKDGVNKPLSSYTLMPARMQGFYRVSEIKTMEKANPFAFTKEMPVMRFNEVLYSEHNHYNDVLFDLSSDPEQNKPVNDNFSLKKEMEEKLRVLMKETDAPSEQFIRLGLD